MDTDAAKEPKEPREQNGWLKRLPVVVNLPAKAELEKNAVREGWVDGSFGMHFAARKILGQAVPSAGWFSILTGKF